MINAAKCPVNSKHNTTSLGFSFVVVFDYYWVWLIRPRVTVFPSLMGRVRRTRNDLCYPYFSPEVMEKLVRGHLMPLIQFAMHLIECNPGYTLNSLCCDPIRWWTNLCPLFNDNYTRAILNTAYSGNLLFLPSRESWCWLLLWELLPWYLLYSVLAKESENTILS